MDITTCCWTDYVSSLEWGSVEWGEAVANDKHATCLLPRGHDGPHEWTNDDEIVITFGAGGE